MDRHGWVWHCPLRPSSEPSFTSGAGMQSRSRISNTLGSKSRDQGICGSFWICHLLLSQGVVTEASVESQRARHPFFWCGRHKWGPESLTLGVASCSREHCFGVTGGGGVDGGGCGGWRLGRKLPPCQTGSLVS